MAPRCNQPGLVGRRIGALSLCLVLAVLRSIAFSAFWVKPGQRPTARSADAKGRPASLLYEEQDDFEETDENFDEITIDSVTSLDEDDDDDIVGRKPRKRIKTDMDPKFKRAGYFERQDLGRLDPSEFDKRGALQRLSVEDLERRVEKRFGWKAKAKPQQVSMEAKVEADSDVDDYDLFWKPAKNLRPAKSERPLRSARPSGMVRPEVIPQPPVTPVPPVPQPGEAERSARGRPRSLESWLLDKDSTKRKQRKKEEDMSEPSDRIGTSKYRKMYKDLMSKSEKASCLKLANGHRL